MTMQLLPAILAVVLDCMIKTTCAQTISMVFESTSGNIVEGEFTSFQCSAIGADTSTRDPRLEWRIKDTATGTFENVTHLATTVNNADTTDGDVTQTISFQVTPDRVGKQLFCSAYDTPGATLSNSDSIADILISTGLGDTCQPGDCGNLASVCVGQCVCADGYYDNNGALDGGTCEPRIALGEPCTSVPNACAAANSQCINGVCSCTAGYSQFGDICTSGTLTLGQQCTVGSCAVPHSSCVAGICQCDPGYLPEGDTECRKPNLDESCESSVGCFDTSTGPGTTGAQCPSGTCVCPSGYYRDGDMCKSKIVLGGICTGFPSDQCAAANSACINGVCTCDTGFTQSGDSCTPQTSILGQPCTAGSCSIPNSACLNGVCACSPGYHPEGDSVCREPKLEESCETSVGCLDTSSGADTTPPVCLQGECACPADYYGFDDVCYTFTLGQPCSVAVPCAIPNSACVGGVCECETGYIPVDDTGCRKPLLTEPCVTSVGCQDTSVGPRTTAAECNAGTCSCPVNNVAFDNICYKQGTVNQPCTVGVPNICTVANSLCSPATDTCVCSPGYFLDINLLNLGEPCSTSDPCTVPNSQCVNGFCECSVGYYPVGVSGCRLPFVDEACSPLVGCLDTSSGPNTGAPQCTNDVCVCPDGYNENGKVCEKPYLGDDCIVSVGCNEGASTSASVAPQCITGVCTCPDNTYGNVNVCNIPNVGGVGNDDDDGLSTEAIAAIVIGSILLLLLAAILLICCCKYGLCRKRDKIAPEDEVKPYIPSVVGADESLHYYLKPAATIGPIISLFVAGKNQPRPHQLPTLDTEYLITDDDGKERSKKKKLRHHGDDETQPRGDDAVPPGADNSGGSPPGGDNAEGESHPTGDDAGGESHPNGDDAGGESHPTRDDVGGESRPTVDSTGGGEGEDSPLRVPDEDEDIVVIPGGESPMHCVDLYD